MKLRWSGKDDVLLVDNWLNGVPAAKIAEHFGCTTSAVYGRVYWLRKKGVKIPARTPLITGVDVEALNRLIQEHR